MEFFRHYVIHKSGKASYATSDAYRPISPKSFLLITTERIVGTMNKSKIHNVIFLR